MFNRFLNIFSKNIVKEFLYFTIPSVVGMIVSSLYAIIDGIFVGRGVGEIGLGAVNIVYPFIMLQIALTFLVAVGGANHFSKNKGKDNIKEAVNVFHQSLFVLIVISLTVNLITLAFPYQIAKLLGANEALMPHVLVYLKWTAFFGILYTPSIGVSIFIRNDNAPHLEMIGTIVGTVINIVLDYYFIIVLGYGLAGAAVATGIGQTVSVFIFLSHFLKKDRILNLKIKHLEFTWVKRILFNGLPSFLMQFSQSAIALSFNMVLLASIGTEGLSAYSVVVYISTFFNMFLIGVVQGSQPLMSFYYGKNNIERVDNIYKLAIFTSILSSCLSYVFIYFFNSQVTHLFIKESNSVFYIASNMIKYYFLAFLPIGLSLINILYLQITENEKWSIIVSALRCIGFVQVALFFLTGPLGYLGIYISFFIGEIFNCLVSIVPIKIKHKEIIQTYQLRLNQS